MVTDLTLHHTFSVHCGAVSTKHCQSPREALVLNSCLPCVSTVPVEPGCWSLSVLILLVAFLSNTHIFSQCHSKHLRTLKTEYKVKAGFLRAVIPTLQTGRNSHPVCKLFHSSFTLAVLRQNSILREVIRVSTL